MDLKKYLIPDSKKCISFLDKIKRDNYFQPSTQLTSFINLFLTTYNKIYSQFDIQLENYHKENKVSQLPHFINFLKQFKQPNKVITEIISLSSNLDIFDLSLVSELISSINKDEINRIYNIGIKSYHPLSYNSEIYQNFCPLIVQYEIEQKLSYRINHYSQYDNCLINIETLTNQHSIKLSYIRDIMTRLLSINKISEVNMNRIRCKFWLTKQKKNLPKNKILTSDSVNTASTYCHNCDHVKIWRIEESKKVICHEIFHCLGLDFHDFPLNLLEALKSKLNLPNNINILLFESYVETWATIINCICYANLFKFENQELFLNFIQKIIEYEICFATFQTAKILNFFGFKTYQQFFNIKGFSNLEKSNQFQQTSCSLSYYIIKSALLYNINNFISFCQKHNKPSILNFNRNLSTCQDYIKLILESLDKPYFKQDINSNLILFQKNQIKDHFILNTLRMTGIEYY